MYAPLRQIDAPLRLPVQKWMKIAGIGSVAVGRLESGVLNAGDKIVIMPNGVAATAISIERHHASRKSAQAGDLIAVCVR
jgi:elongation factor 1-alpha